MVLAASCAVVEEVGVMVEMQGGSSEPEVRGGSSAATLGFTLRQRNNRWPPK